MAPPRTLPGDAEAYRQTKVFTAKSVPRGLLAQHSTKAGTWGVIYVRAGEVKYFLDGEAAPLATLQAGQRFVVLPEEVHFVRLSADAEFLVEFHKRPSSAAPDDPHR